MEKSYKSIIKEYRIKKGISQEKLAEMIDKTPRQIQRIEHNVNNTKLSTLRKLIIFLDITDEDIINIIREKK